jgi:hypothetical protein
VKTKDWEKKVKFKDDFGPSLDELEGLIKKLIDAQMKIADVTQDICRVAKAVAATKESYERKIIKADIAGDIEEGEGIALRKAIDSIAEVAAGLLKSSSEGVGRRPTV